MITICLISVFEPGIWADDQALLRGAEVNDEGFGYAIADKGELITWKDTCGPLLAVARFLVEREAHPDGFAVFHSRLSTGSAVSASHCHPFIVPGDEQTAIFHNGSLPYGEWSLAEGESDTEIFAEHSFPALFSDLDDPATFDMLESWATPANKLVIITANPRYKDSVYIVSRDQFIADKHGALHSNADFLGRGKGWDEAEIDGELHRWNLWQPGQCAGCHAFHDGDKHPLPLRTGMPRQRNETERSRKVAAANGKETK